MRHRRGIDLTGGGNDNVPPKPTGIFVPQRDHSATLADLPQWYVVGAQKRSSGAPNGNNKRAKRYGLIRLFCMYKKLAPVL